MSISYGQELLVKVKFLSPLCKSENFNYATKHSAGLDLRACIDQPISIQPQEKQKIPTGIALEITNPCVAGFIFSRSGLGTKQGIVVTQGVGVVDPDYRGEILVSLFNLSSKIYTISPGERIAQLVFMPFFKANLLPSDVLSPTKRGDGGFGHTGNF
ncbi:MAG: dUTP diphosphatase [Desulfonauticus sp.]|nr:dUTP diphosphatase [Desulfonauticus sp.]